MAKHSNRRKAPKGHRRGPGHHGRGERRPDLIDEVTTALGSGEPLDLLGFASSFLAATDPRERHPFEVPAEEAGLPPREALLQTFFGTPLVATSALLAASAGLTGDELLRSRVHREIAARGDVLPRWLAQLEQARAGDTVWQVSDVLGDGESLVLGVTLTGDHELTAAVYVDHNMGTLVKDAIVVPGSVPELLAALQENAAGPDVTVTEIDPADGRARITEAIEHGAITFPPVETDTWPAARPLVEWMIGLLPPGGRGYVRPEWSQQEREALAGRVLASPFGAGLDDPDRRDLLGELLWFGTDYGPGDPLRWSPVAVEILLADWIPRKIVADVRYLAKAPEVLRALIRFSHAEKGLRPELTAETLAAVDQWEPEYQETIRSPRLQGPEALLAAVGVLDPDEYFDAVEREDLERAVGGARALAELDTAPLPDEPFAWEPVPAAALDRVTEIVELVDQACDELLDRECRTAARRLLAAAVESDPAGVLRGRALTTAAAVCWTVAKANGRLSRYGLQSKQLLEYFGVGRVSQRSEVLRRAIGVGASGPDEMFLESPRYLTGARRQQIVADRDRLSGGR